MKRFKLLVWVLCLALLFVPVYSQLVYATTADSSYVPGEAVPEDSDGESSEPEDSSPETPETPSVDVDSSIGLTDNWQTPVATYGKSVDIVLPIVNLDKYDITNVRVTPELSTDTSSWPFEIEKSSYTTELFTLAGSNSGADELSRRQEITYTFKTRKDVATGYQKLTFDVSYTDINGTKQNGTIGLYIKTVGAPGSGNGTNTGATPRLIISGFSTDGDVNAGKNFKLTLHIKNTSSITAINNVQLDLQATTEGSDDATSSAAFLPVNGSSTIFVSSIKAGETQDVSIDMNAKSDLSQKPYTLDVKMAYQDSSYKEYTTDASVSIPVKQQARYEVSSIEVMPASMPIGAQANVTFSIYNTGKTKLYNVSVKFEGDSVTGGDTYIGNIDSGATGNVDTMLTGSTATADDGSIKAIVSYEDESGNVSTSEQTFNLMITDNAMNGGGIDGGIVEEPPVPQKSAFPIVLIIIICVVVIAAIVGVVIFLRIRKKKKVQKEEEDFISNFDYYDSQDGNQTASLNDNVEDKDTASKKEGQDDEIS